MSYIKNSFLNPSTPKEYRTNFIHLYLDIGWFGVLSGSSINFINVYATRIGASAFQIGLIGAMSAVISLLFAIPAARWLEKRTKGRGVFWVSVFYRIGFLLYIPLTWVLNPQTQIWGLVFLSLMMGIPLVALSVGFSSLFADSVPAEWRAHVAAVRNIVLSVMFMLTSLVSGFLLDTIVFPLNYQIVFLIGFIGAAMSSYHLYFIKPSPSRNIATRSQDLVPQNKESSTAGNNWTNAIRFDVWRTPYRSVLLVMAGFHVTQYLALPIFPLFFIRYLKLTDQNLGIGTALFYLAVLLGSTRLSYFVRKLGHKNVTAWSVVGLALYPGLLAFSNNVWHYYIISALGGLVWAFVSGASPNYILEKCPDNDRPSHLAWYNIILNASILFGSLVGPSIADYVSLPVALIIFSVARGLAGFALLKWG